jgi:hypothetical protein
VEDLVGDVVLETKKSGKATILTFASGRLLIISDEGLIIRRTQPPMVIGSTWRLWGHD